MPPYVETENIFRQFHIKKVAPYPITVLDWSNVENTGSGKKPRKSFIGGIGVLTFAPLAFKVAKL